MALTRLDLTGDNTTTVYDLTFALGYLQENDIFVYLASDVYTTQIAYSFLNATQIVLDAPVGAGVAFHIRRVTDRNAPINDYQQGAILREKNLDDSFLQSLMILEEIEDGYLSTSGASLLADLDMNGNKIINLGDPVNPQDAVPYHEVQTLDSRLTAVEGSTTSSSRYIHWLYRNGVAIGGEVVIDIPYTFTAISTVYVNGVRQTLGLAFDYDVTAKTVEFAEALEAGDEVVVSIGTEPVDDANDSLGRAAAVLQFDQVIAQSMTIASGSNALSISPTVPVGVVVTVPVDSVYVIL